jgi:hypothetical protein
MGVAFCFSSTIGVSATNSITIRITDAALSDANKLVKYRVRLRCMRLLSAVFGDDGQLDADIVCRP